MEKVVDAVRRFSTDKTLHGRAVAVVPQVEGGEELVDLYDDEDRG